ncbi:MAG: tellurite-like stress resistance cysteine protease StiP [Atribacterota bacterium]|jgi:ribosomal protein L7Ae-like RNA K-turn-binding protein|nr:tellurite-like stress resistance cysteine protease StiP [Atribacterota bacterium]
MFSGSYRPEDVAILLKPRVETTRVDVATKEALIQSGTKHYSEMISPESLPSTQYLELFHQSWRRNGDRMASDLLLLAALIAENKQGSITLVSLARAGTPVGVILKRLLSGVFNRETHHYSVSIIRDRGIDMVAMDHILSQGHKDQSIVFIDGWTGKGVITRELKDSIAHYNLSRGKRIDESLWVLADLAGVAAQSATQDDYLIPSSILNATVSGLISRSILDEQIGIEDFHGCLYYREFEPADVSLQFADDMTGRAINSLGANREASLDLVKAAAKAHGDIKAVMQRKELVEQLMRDVMRDNAVSDINHIKPGIGEATRVLLRREPGLLLIAEGDKNDDVQHMVVLAEEKGIPVDTRTDLGPYQAIAIIKNLKKGLNNAPC